MADIKNKAVLVLLLILIFTVYKGVDAQSLRVEIPRNVVVQGDWITLGDIALIEGIGGKELESISSLRLGQAVHPGYTRTIPREQVVLMLLNQGFNENDLKLDIPDMIRVRTASQTISREELTASAEEYILANLDYARDKITIIPGSNVNEIIIPDGSYHLEYKPSFNENFTGNVSLNCRIIVNEREHRTDYLNFEVRIKEEVYIARRRIKRGEYLDRNDFKLETKEVSEIRGELITDFDNSLVKDGVVGVPISAGEVLSTYHLYLPEIIGPGDKVRAEVINGSIKVSTEVEAKQSGKKGEYIIVENIDSGYRFRARIINAHLVQVVL